MAFLPRFREAAEAGMLLPVAGVASCVMSASATRLLATRDDRRGAWPSDILHTSLNMVHVYFVYAASPTPTGQAGHQRREYKHDKHALPTSRQTHSLNVRYNYTGV